MLELAPAVSGCCNLVVKQPVWAATSLICPEIFTTSLLATCDMAGDDGGDEAGWEQTGRQSSSRSGRGPGRGSGPSQRPDNAAPAWGKPNTSQPSAAPQVQAVAGTLVSGTVIGLATAVCSLYHSDM